MSWFSTLLSAGVSQSYDLLKFSLKYNTTDFAYLTSTVYSDAGTVKIENGLVRVITAGNPDANFVTSAMYLYATDPADDRIMVRDSNGLILVFDNTLAYLSTITPQVSYTFSQGCCIDSSTQRIYSYASSGVVTVFNLSGNVIEQLTAPAIAQSIHWNYDYVNAKFYVAVQGTLTGVQVWVRSGNTLVLSETKWYTARGGVALDNIKNHLIVAHNTGVNLRFRDQSIDGLEEVNVSYHPFANGYTVEGLCCTPAGSYLSADPSGHDTPIVGGNRLWEWDQRNERGKYDRFPSMTRGNRFTGGILSGILDTQKITQSVGGKIYSPVYDTNGFPNTENASAWEFEFSEGGDADVTFVGSNTAPTGSSKTNYYSNIPQYAGWGETIPSAEQGIPGNFRYKQCILRVKTATPSGIITLQDLLTAIPTLKILENDKDTTMMQVLPDSSPANLVDVVANHAVPTNFFSGAGTTRYIKQTNYLDDQTNGAVMNLLTPSAISGDQTGQIIAVREREATNLTDVILGVGTSGSQANRIAITHNSSALSPNSSLTITQTDGSATVINRVSIADTALAFKRWDIYSDGASWHIKINGVDQTLVVNTGSNNGNWFGDLSSPNIASRGFVAGINGRGRYRFFAYSSAVLDSTQNALIDAYIAQENLLA